MSANNKKKANKPNKQPRASIPHRNILDTLYNVKSLDDKEIRDSRVMYRIQWVGFPQAKDNTWEPTENICTVVGDIIDYEVNKHPNQQLKYDQIKLDIVAQYREYTIENELMTQVLAFDTVNQVFFVLWENGMVITLHVKELDSKMILGIGCLINRNFEKLFTRNIGAFEQRVEALKESELLQERNETELLPSLDDIARLSNVFKGFISANGWPVTSVEGDPSRIMVNPKEPQERSDYGDELIQCTMCDTCGRYFPYGPNYAFFKHLLQAQHNGIYLKDLKPE